jgi:hypothetical protein
LVGIREDRDAHAPQIRINSAGLHGPPRTVAASGTNENHRSQNNKERSEKLHQAASHVAHSSSTFAGSVGLQSRRKEIEVYRALALEAMTSKRGGVQFVPIFPRITVTEAGGSS